MDLQKLAGYKAKLQKELEQYEVSACYAIKTNGD